MDLSNIMLHITRFPQQLPKRSLMILQIMFAWILKYFNSAYIYQDRALVEESVFMQGLQIPDSTRSEQRKGAPLWKPTNKDHLDV